MLLYSIVCPNNELRLCFGGWPSSKTGQKLLILYRAIECRLHPSSFRLPHLNHNSPTRSSTLALAFLHHRAPHRMGASLGDVRSFFWEGFHFHPSLTPITLPSLSPPASFQEAKAERHGWQLIPNVQLRRRVPVETGESCLGSPPTTPL